MPQSAVVHAVLLIDDDPILADLYAGTLERAGYEVTRAASAGDALTALETQRFAAVVSDVRLPGLNGIRLFESVCERFPSAAQRWGFCTAWDDPSVRELVRCRQIPLLRKPCRLEEFEAFVKRLVPHEPPRVQT